MPVQIHSDDNADITPTWHNAAHQHHATSGLSHCVLTLLTSNVMTSLVHAVGRKKCRNFVKLVRLMIFRHCCICLAKTNWMIYTLYGKTVITWLGGFRLFYPIVVFLQTGRPSWHNQHQRWFWEMWITFIVVVVVVMALIMSRLLQQKVNTLRYA